MKSSLFRVLFLALVGFVWGCDSSTTAPADAPEGHTIRKDGVFHSQGLSNPVANCTACHGADLMGGSQGQPSCFSCHGKKW